MMYGYEISGTDSASEFASLKAIAADPTYVVAAPDSVDQIQGVAYRNGQIILSRSYGARMPVTLRSIVARWTRAPRWTTPRS